MTGITDFRPYSASIEAILKTIPMIYEAYFADKHGPDYVLLAGKFIRDHGVCQYNVLVFDDRIKNLLSKGHMYVYVSGKNVRTDVTTDLDLNTFSYVQKSSLKYLRKRVIFDIKYLLDVNFND